MLLQPLDQSPLSGRIHQPLVEPAQVARRHGQIIRAQPQRIRQPRRNLTICSVTDAQIPTLQQQPLGVGVHRRAHPTSKQLAHHANNRRDRQPLRQMPLTPRRDPTVGRTPPHRRPHRPQRNPRRRVIAAPTRPGESRVVPYHPPPTATTPSSRRGAGTRRCLAGGSVRCVGSVLGLRIGAARPAAASPELSASVRASLRSAQHHRSPTITTYPRRGGGLGRWTSTINHAEKSRHCLPVVAGAGGAESLACETLVLRVCSADQSRDQCHPLMLGWNVTILQTCGAQYSAVGAEQG